MIPFLGRLLRVPARPTRALVVLVALATLGVAAMTSPALPADSRSTPSGSDGAGLMPVVADGHGHDDDHEHTHAAVDCTSPGECTHGSDPLPPGASGLPVAALPPQSRGARRVACTHDGQSGARVQMLYVRASDRPDRFAEYRDSFQTWTAQMDQIFTDSAPDSPVPAHVRFVHDSSCLPVVEPVVVSPSGDDSFEATIAELGDRGYDRTDRTYLAFVDADVVCGIGTIVGDDSDTPRNANNSGPSYARADTVCWDPHTIAHELMHNLGGIQLSAPNSSGGYHCTDESDVMCYSDSPYFPAMRQVCDGSAEMLFDCGDDDYYDATPTPGSYLDTHWNTIDSAFLTTGAEATCPDASSEPDDSLSTAVDVELGAADRRAFCATDDEDWFRFRVTAGRRYDVATLDLADGADTVLDVLDASGGLLASDDDSGGGLASLVSLTAMTTGSMYARVRSFSGAPFAGSYSFRVRESGDDTTDPASTKLVNGGFERDADGDSRPDAWTSTSAFSRTSADAISGRWSGRVAARRDRDVVVQQRVGGIRGGHHYVAAAVVVVPPTRDRFRFVARVLWEDADLAVIGSRRVLAVRRSTLGRGHGIDLVAPPGATSVRVQLVVTSLRSRILVDDVVFRPSS